MAINVILEGETLPAPKPIPFAIRMVRSDGGDVVFHAVCPRKMEIDSISRGTLFTLTPSGCLSRCYCVNPAFGFDLDSEGRIKVEGLSDAPPAQPRWVACVRMCPHVQWRVLDCETGIWHRCSTRQEADAEAARLNAEVNGTTPPAPQQRYVRVEHPDGGLCAIVGLETRTFVLNKNGSVWWADSPKADAEVARLNAEVK